MVELLALRAQMERCYLFLGGSFLWSCSAVSNAVYLSMSVGHRKSKSTQILRVVP